MRRLLILLLFGLILTGGAAITWQAMGHAKLVEEDLTTARSMLGWPAPAGSSPASSRGG